MTTVLQVTSWLTYWKPERPFPMDMAGFAINLKLFFDSPNAWFSNAVPRGYLESTILEQLHVKMADLEPKADNCSKVCRWQRTLILRHGEINFELINIQ